jgi:hypothetical protein
VISGASRREFDTIPFSLVGKTPAKISRITENVFADRELKAQAVP